MSGAIAQNVIDEAARLHARGDAGPDSDVDLLASSRASATASPRFCASSACSRRCGCRPTSSSHMQQCGGVAGTMLNDAPREGRVVAQA